MTGQVLKKSSHGAVENGDAHSASHAAEKVPFHPLVWRLMLLVGYVDALVHMHIRSKKNVRFQFPTNAAQFHATQKFF